MEEKYIKLNLGVLKDLHNLMEVQLKDDLVIIIGTTDQHAQVEYRFTARGAVRAGLIEENILPK